MSKQYLLGYLEHLKEKLANLKKSGKRRTEDGDTAEKIERVIEEVKKMLKNRGVQ